MNTNNTVKSLWISDILGDMQILCINSFLKQGIRFELYSYGNITNLPIGVELRDANEILQKKLIFRDVKESYATFSDWFRMKLLYETGGWWVDCDVVCLKKFDFIQEYVFATESFFHEGKPTLRLCNAIIKMPAKTELGAKILKSIYNKFSTTPFFQIRWTEIGAKLIYEAIRDSIYLEFIQMPDVFCPIPYREYINLIDDLSLTLSDRTYGVHLWNKMWEWNNINPFNEFQKKSLLETFMININANPTNNPSNLEE